MFHHASADRWTQGGEPLTSALAKVTCLGVGAHQDDLEILAYPGILAGLATGSFGGVTCTDGRGSPRAGVFADVHPDDLALLRIKEQRDAARIGNYRCMIQLGHASAEVREPHPTALIDDLEAILHAARPEVVYTHHPADRHPTHLGVFRATVAALRRLPPNQRPHRVIGGEVWGSLDWLDDADKVVLDVSGHTEFGERLLRVFRSQIEGGKRYDLAVLGRRRANATFTSSHQADAAQEVCLAMDLSPLIDRSDLTVADFLEPMLQRFCRRVRAASPERGQP